MNRLGTAHVKPCIAALLALSLSIGSAWSQNTPATYQPGFLSQEIQLKPVPGHPETLRYIAQDYAAEHGKFHAIYIAPIEVWVAPDSPYQGMAADDIEALTAHFKQALDQALSHSIRIVDQPRPDALTIRIALTNVELKHARFKLLQLTPVGAVVTGVKYAAGISKVTVQHMVVQAEGLEPADGKTLFAVVNYPLTQQMAAQVSQANGGEAIPPDGPVRLDQLPELLASHALRLQRVLLDLPVGGSR